MSSKRLCHKERENDRVFTVYLEKKQTCKLLSIKKKTTNKQNKESDFHDHIIQMFVN